MNREIAGEQLARGQAVACEKGCFQCCISQYVPVTPPESLGISWYVSEAMDEVERDRLFERLKYRDNSFGCPFLMAGICSIHPVRPLACRKFIVYGVQCSSADGDPFYNRPEDMHPNFNERNLKIAMRFLDSPVYEFPTEAVKMAAYKNGLLNDSIPAVNSIDWIGFIEATKGMVSGE